MSRLTELDACCNFFQGHLPQAGLEGTTKLRVFHVHANHFEGALPERLQGRREMTRFQVQQNRLTGTLSEDRLTFSSNLIFW
eukprot:4269114-Amphidinium_carterae.1